MFAYQVSAERDGVQFRCLFRIRLAVQAEFIMAGLVEQHRDLRLGKHLCRRQFRPVNRQPNQVRIPDQTKKIFPTWLEIIREIQNRTIKETTRAGSQVGMGLVHEASPHAA